MRKTLASIILASLAVSILTISSAHAASGIVLPGNFVQRKGKFTCGYVGGKWQPGSVRSSKFYAYSVDVTALKKQVRKLSGKKRNAVLAQISVLEAKIKIFNRQLCSKLKKPIAPTATPIAQPTSSPTALPTGTPAAVLQNLSQLPDTGQLAAARSAEAGAFETIEAVIGNPPALAVVPTVGAKNVFWRPGVIDAINAGTATEQQCSEYFAGQVDGESGGLGSCYMAQGVGAAFEPILAGGRSLCFMKEAPTKANYDAGAITVQKGSLPDDDVSKLFSVPAGATDRLVEVQTSAGPGGAQSIFLRIHSAAKNAEQGDMYGVDLWFCRSGDPNAAGYEKISIGTDGTYEDEIARMPEQFKAIIAGVVKPGDNGKYIFDTTRDRQAVINVVPTPGALFKGSVLITADNLMKSKAYDVVSGAMGTQSRKGYSVARFSGTSVDDLRFLEGAYRNQISQDGTPVREPNGGVEYRSSYYAAAPSNELVNEVSKVNIGTDTFFASEPSVQIDTSAYACTAEADIVVSMNMSNPTLAHSLAECAKERLHGMGFCNRGDLAMTQANFLSSCMGAPH